MSEKVQYTAREAHSLSTAVKLKNADGTVERIAIHFKNGLFETDDARVIEVFDQQIATSPNFAALVQKLDRRAALKVAQEHRELFATQNTAARGGTNSENAKLADRQSQYDKILQVVKDPAKAQQIVDEMRGSENLAVTEDIEVDEDHKADDTPDDGFRPGVVTDKEIPEEIPVREGTAEEAKSAQDQMKEEAPAPNPFKKAKGN